jgi:hypothetical protein
MAKYQVAMSFAGEQRAYVEQVVRSLQSFGIAVFYDDDNKVQMWGKDGVEFFHQIFSAETAYVIMFVSQEYVSKKWTKHERRSALSKAIAEEGEYVLPVRFDDTPVPGLPDTVQYLRADKIVPHALATMICKKIGIDPLTSKASSVPPPQMSSAAGTVVFDYASHNGVYVIGQGEYLFETRWSKASDTSIYLLNDPPSIHGIAVAIGKTEISEVNDATLLDFSSRHRSPKLGQVAILRNTKDFYAAIKILAIADDSRGANRDELRFDYVIQVDGSANFNGA